MPTSAETALVDTNVLVYAHFSEMPNYAASRELLNQVQRGEAQIAVAAQSLAEFYAVVTDSRRVSIARSSAEALSAIRGIVGLSGIVLLPVPTDLLDRWMALVSKYPLTRGAVFDLQLVATMLANGVTSVYSYDRAHFDRFDEITLLTP